jgi:D-3-phosphoglycerate dehydrogenase / 2-oxoglutarate reductase
MIRVMIADPISLKAIEKLNEIPEIDLLHFDSRHIPTLPDEIRQIDALVTGGTAVPTRDFFAQAERLKLIVCTTPGPSQVITEMAAHFNFEIRYTPAATAISAAEFTLAVMLGSSRHIGPSFCAMKAHQSLPPAQMEGLELRDKILGIIGFGRIGQEVAHRAACFGMKILYFDQREIKSKIPAKPVTLNTLLKSSDFITLHLPKSPQTTHFLAGNELALMKKDAALINISDNSLIDPAALAARLDTGALSAVALDTVDLTSIEHLALIDHPRVFPTSRLSSLTHEGQERMGLEMIEILQDFFNV